MKKINFFEPVSKDLLKDSNATVQVYDIDHPTVNYSDELPENSQHDSDVSDDTSNSPGM